VNLFFDSIMDRAKSLFAEIDGMDIESRVELTNAIKSVKYAAVS